MKKMQKRLALALLAANIFFLLPLAPPLDEYAAVRSAYGEEEWKKEFEALCSRTDDAMTFSKEELKDLIARCDKLKTVILTLDESTKKVYLRRLQLCRDLFAFVLESKEKN